VTVVQQLLFGVNVIVHRMSFWYLEGVRVLNLFEPLCWKLVYEWIRGYEK